MKWPRSVALIAAVALAPPPAAAQSSAAAGQAKADFSAWKAIGRNDADVDAFNHYLKTAGVDDVLPTYQILRTSSSWRECGATPFVVAPRLLWPDIIQTLRFIKQEVKPAIGGVEAVSGYREPLLNRCSHGATHSAHADFWALDLVPTTSIGRVELIRRLCGIHARAGIHWAVGLGFYSATRFHIDTKRYRRWGSDGRGETSPCAMLAPPPAFGIAPDPVRRRAAPRAR